MSPHYSEERQRKLLKTLHCPECHAQNQPNKKEMLELDVNGQAYCNACGKFWTVDEKEK